MKIRTVLDYQNLFTHCSLIGSTGSGKTSYMKAIIKDLIMYKKNNCLIIIDGKNDDDFKKFIQQCSEAKGYKFFSFTNDLFKNSNFNYDCLAEKNKREILEIINRLRIKEIKNSSLGASYYFEQGQKLISVLLSILETKNILYSWKNLAFYSDKKNLKSLIEGDTKEKQDIYSISDETYIEIKSFFLEMDNIMPSKNDNISCKSILSNYVDSVILFSLDFLTLPIASKNLAQAICLDIRQSVRVKKSDLFCFFDEFGSYINQDLTTLLEQGRSYKVGLIFSYQSVSQLNKQEFKNILFDNTSNWFIFNNKNEQSLKELSLLFGMTKQLATSYSFDLNEDCVTKGSYHSVDVQKVTPNDIRELLPLECFIKTVKIPRFFARGIQFEEE